MEYLECTQVIFFYLKQCATSAGIHTTWHLSPVPKAGRDTSHAHALPSFDNPVTVASTEMGETISFPSPQNPMMFYEHLCDQKVIWWIFTNSTTKQELGNRINESSVILIYRLQFKSHVILHISNTTTDCKMLSDLGHTANPGTGTRKWALVFRPRPTFLLLLILMLFAEIQSPKSCVSWSRNHQLDNTGGSPASPPTSSVPLG